ncbi:dimethylargininase [Kitasatospora camelliae]|uniref:Dimethylargininase n=1 Tax=Kitasatospora camelliae TaxID=3156397 RepID=A0AAU8K5Y4_9ACTN
MRTLRTARPRHYLMCRPTHFDVVYSINPWMDPRRAVDTALAVRQWERLREVYLDLGHTVELIDPAPGLPDMVFAANGATVIDGRALVARFRDAERAAEAPAYAEWLRGHGFADLRTAELVNEGEGDYLLAGEHLLAGTGFRSDPRSHAEAGDFFGRDVVSLTLVDPNYYHLDTALAVLDDATIAYYPPAFSADSRSVLERLFPDAVIAGDADAKVFGLNAASDGRHVVLPQDATALADQLRNRGFHPIGLDLSELLKAGGSIKCCTLELRPAP